MSPSHIFDMLSERYDSWFKINPILAENELRVLLSLGLKGLGLEVGVGSGWFASRLNVPIGIDPSISMLKLAHKRGIEVIRAIGERLPFRDNVFDYALLIVTLCFVDNPSEVLAEVARVVKTNGFVVACIIPRDSAWGHYYMKLGEQGHPFYCIAKFYTINEVERLFTKVGLRIEDHRAALSFKPWGKPVEEEPSRDIRGKGFVCIVASKRHYQE